MRRRRRIAGLAAIALLVLGLMASVGTMLTGVGPPTAVFAITPPDTGTFFIVPVTVGLVAVSTTFLMAMVALRLTQTSSTQTTTSRLRAAFAMSAFTRAVTQAVFVVPIKGMRQRAITTIELVSGIPDRIAAAIRQRHVGFGEKTGQTRLQTAVCLN